MKLTVVLLLVLAALSAPSQFTWTGPVATPLGDASIVESGSPGVSDGLTVTVSGLDTSQWATLLWSQAAGSVALSLDYTGSYGTKEVMKFDAIAGSSLTWDGQTTMRVKVGPNVQTLDIDTRLVITPVSGVGPVDGGDWNLSAVGGLMKPVTVNTSSFVVNIRADARENGTLEWYPYQEFYDLYLHPAGSQLSFSSQAGFYQSWDRFYGGSVLTPDFIGTDKSLSSQTFDFVVETLDGTQLSTMTFRPDDNGSFAVHDINQYPNGIYRFSTKGPQWLRSKITRAVPGGAQQSGLTFNCINGDIDSDNAITVFDYMVLSDYFDRINGDGLTPAWKVDGPNGFAPIDADLDGDGAITVFDYAILSTNFDMMGD